MAERLIERGIGETREVLVEDGEIAEARIRLDGVVAAGSLVEASLKRAGTPATAVAGGDEYLLPKGAPGMSEGATLRIEVTREAFPGAEAWKRPLARVADRDGDARPESGIEIPFPSPDDRLAALGWLDLVDEARSGIVRFPGGELRVFVTPAMTLIDVDGAVPPDELAVAGARAAAKAVRRHGIGGSIGIDLPTVGKADRQAAAQAIDAALPQPFERTAVNGFGFVLIVRPRRHASLFELAGDRAAFEARALLRSAARHIGPARLVAHPSVIAAIEARPRWVEAISGQVGGAVSLRADPKLPISGGHVEQG